MTYSLTHVSVKEGLERANLFDHLQMCCMKLVKINLRRLLYLEKRKQGEHGKCPITICITCKSRRNYIINCFLYNTLK